MKNEIFKAKIKVSGQIIEVYGLRNGYPTTAHIWTNAFDCKTSYTQEELEFKLTQQEISSYERKAN